MAEEESNRLLDVVVRIQNVIMDPDSEWTAIAEESSSSKEIYGFYVIPLATISPIAWFIGATYLSAFRIPVTASIVMALSTYVIALASVFLLSQLIYGLTFVLRDHNEKSKLSALKIAAYSYIPVWLAGIFLAVPVLILFTFVFALYGIYPLYVGLLRVLKIPEWKAACYAVVVVAAAVTLSFLPSWSHKQWAYAFNTWLKVESQNPSTKRHIREVPGKWPYRSYPTEPSDIPEEPPPFRSPGGKPRPAPIVPSIHPEDNATQ